MKPTSVRKLRAGLPLQRRARQAQYAPDSMTLALAGATEILISAVPSHRLGRVLNELEAEPCDDIHRRMVAHPENRLACVGSVLLSNQAWRLSTAMADVSAVATRPGTAEL